MMGMKRPDTVSQAERVTKQTAIEKEIKNRAKSCSEVKAVGSWTTSSVESRL